MCVEVDAEFVKRSMLCLRTMVPTEKRLNRVGKNVECAVKDAV